MTTHAVMNQSVKRNRTSLAGRYGGWPRRWAVLMVTLVSFVAVAIAARPATAAAAPGNDAFTGATAISALPFGDSGDLTGNTTETDEPQPCDAQAQTIWYTFRPTVNATVKIDMDGSDFNAGANVYQSSGTGFGGLQHLGCADGNRAANFVVRAATTYYVQVGSFSTGTANFQLHLREIPPPPNDDFANATPVTPLPFSETVDHLIAATVEPSEPTPCFGGAVVGTAWWAFTPTTNGSYLASFPGVLSPSLAVYTGSSLSGLKNVACGGRERVTFQATAGTTYYVRTLLNDARLDFPGTFRLETTPQPVADFGFFPTDPSIFDAIQFSGFPSDPAGFEIQTQAWSFGDGATAQGCCPTHQYAKDKNYTATLTVTTSDGRTASISRVVHVSTHDVGIVQIDVPNSARVGRTIEITVYVKNYRQPESVRVDLLKSTPQGFGEPFASRTQTVPLKAGGGTTKFSFTNTILAADGNVGKVNFQAVAGIVDGRDAFPTDNEFISPSVTVRPR
jgi:PKD repeat protein